MKTAFVGFGEINTDLIARLLEADEVIAVDTMWTALGELQGSGEVYIPSPQYKKETAVVETARAAGLQVYPLEDYKAEQGDNERYLRVWLGLPDPVEEEPSEDPVPSTPEEVTPEKPEEVPAEEEAPEKETPASASTPSPVSERLARLRRGNPQQRKRPGIMRQEKPVGLAHKVEITSDMLDVDAPKTEREPFTPSELGFLLLVTSGFGGGGKTTCSYYAGQIMAQVLKYARKESQKAIVIEADYNNPKLQNRLRIPAGRDLSKLANFLESVDNGEVPAEDVSKMAESIVQEIIHQDPDSDLLVIACPYEKYTADPAYLREAVRKVVLWAQRTMGYFVILDCDTIGHAEGVNLDLVEMANRILIVTDTKDPRVVKEARWWRKAVYEEGNPNDRSHIDDALVMIQHFTRPLSAHGFGIPGDKVRVFFNRTTSEELKAKVTSKSFFPKNMVVGNLESIPEIERGWAADVGKNRSRTIEVSKSIASMLLRVTGSREVDQYFKSLSSSS